jgi:hypothetical protein
MGDSNMQYVTSTSFLLLAYAKYLTSAHRFVNCGGITVTPKRLRALAKRQVNCISYKYNFLFSMKECDILFIRNKKHKKIFTFFVFLAGGLSARRQPNEDVVHGGVWSKIPSKDTPQGLINPVHCFTPSQDPVLPGVQLHEIPIPQPKHLGGCNRWWARPA